MKTKEYLGTVVHLRLWKRQKEIVREERETNKKLWISRSSLQVLSQELYYVISSLISSLICERLTSLGDHCHWDISWRHVLTSVDSSWQESYPFCYFEARFLFSLSFILYWITSVFVLHHCHRLCLIHCSRQVFLETSKKTRHINSSK
jgi:hypothetical protein